MKKINILLSVVAMSFVMIGCGGGSSSEGETTPPTNLPTSPTPPASVIKGVGTIDDPYIVGSGIYPMTNGEYFSFNTNQVDCNVLIYNIVNFDYVFGPHLFDSNFVEMDSPTRDGLYSLLPQDTYSLKTTNIEPGKNDKGTFGIFSLCVDQPNNAYEPQELQEGIIEQSDAVLYKITSAEEDRIVTISIVEGDAYVDLYNNTLSEKYSGAWEQSYIMNLESGVNYIYIGEITLGSNVVKFNVSFE